MTEPVKHSHETSLFLKFGKELLDETEKTNYITLQQFEPYIELFAPDKERLVRDPIYRDAMQRKQQEYKVNLRINPFYPTIVVDRLEEPRRELIFLDRWFTKLKTGNLESGSAVERVPSNVAQIGGDHRDMLILQASIEDFMTANNAPDQIESFRRERAESVRIMQLFLDRNISPERRAEMVKATDDTVPVSSTDPTVPPVEFGLDDDD